MSGKLQEILSPLSDELQRVDESIKVHIATGVPVIDNSSMHLFLKGGKKIRASLVVLASALKGNIPDGVIDLAAAVEIIHAASLIHDDIIDKSFLRRGNVSVHGKFGEKVAVLAGDYLYSLAVNIAVKDSNRRILDSIADATKEMVKGELYQIEYSNIDKITEDHYYSIIERKTGRLMAASSHIGAVKAGFTDEECNALYSVGLNLGYAFQIVDDTLDFSESSTTTGKDVGNDFRDGKITLPFIHVLTEGSEQQKLRLRDFVNNPEGDNWSEVKGIIHDSGAFEFSFSKAGEFVRKAERQLELFPESPYREAFSGLMNFIVKRNY